MTVQVNKAALSFAKQRIKDGDFSADSNWSDSQPSADDENKYLDKHGWDGYSRWFLAVDTGDDKETKQCYKFPIGDFKKVHRSGVIAAKQRAAQNDYGSVESAADELLTLLDREKAHS